MALEEFFREKLRKVEFEKFMVFEDILREAGGVSMGNGAFMAF